MTAFTIGAVGTDTIPTSDVLESDAIESNLRNTSVHPGAGPVVLDGCCRMKE
jgi:hypothetical protein